MNPRKGVYRSGKGKLLPLTDMEFDYVIAVSEFGYVVGLVILVVEPEASA